MSDLPDLARFSPATGYMAIACMVIDAYGGEGQVVDEVLAPPNLNSLYLSGRDLSRSNTRPKLVIFLPFVQ